MNHTFQVILMRLSAIILSFAGISPAFAAPHSADFSLFNLELQDENPSASGLWHNAEQYANGWSSLAWFGYFVEMEQDWIYHLEHGYQYCLGEDTSSYFFFDQNMESWFWTSAQRYPYLYKSGENPGWYWYYTGGTVGQRWFNRLADASDIQEGAINNQIDPAPASFVRIAPGTFTMGSPTNEPGRFSTEIQHRVTLTRAFWLQSTEVTKAQWDAVAVIGPARGYTDLPAGRNGYNGDASGTHPVTEVNWYDVVKWLNLKSELEGLTPCYTVEGATYKTGDSLPVCDFDASGYRLPTESEWEYACRAGTTTAFYSGPITYTDFTPVDPNLDQIGWYYGNSGTNTHPVGGKQANAWGLYDMSGNVLEWCWDWFFGTYPGSTTDPTGPASGTKRVCRGGYFFHYARSCRSAYRNVNYPDFLNSQVGFRSARTASP